MTKARDAQNVEYVFLDADDRCPGMCQAVITQIFCFSVALEGCSCSALAVQFMLLESAAIDCY